RQCISPGADLPMPQRQCPQRACQRWATGHLRLSPNQVDRSMLRNMIRRLDQSPLIKLVEYAGKFAVLVTVMAFLWHHDQDVKAREAQAWDSILNHQWEPSPSNRAEALSTLITDGVPIAGAPLGPVRFQPQLDLSGCHTLFGVPLFWCRPALMKDAYMEWATLTAVNL